MGLSFKVSKQSRFFLLLSKNLEILTLFTPSVEKCYYEQHHRYEQLEIAT